MGRRRSPASWLTQNIFAELVLTKNIIALGIYRNSKVRVPVQSWCGVALLRRCVRRFVCMRCRCTMTRTPTRTATS